MNLDEQEPSETSLQEVSFTPQYAPSWFDRFTAWVD
jgi:hypothetical protein